MEKKSSSSSRKPQIGVKLIQYNDAIEHIWENNIDVSYGLRKISSIETERIATELSKPKTHLSISDTVLSGFTGRHHTGLMCTSSSIQHAVLLSTGSRLTVRDGTYILGTEYPPTSNSADDEVKCGGHGIKCKDPNSSIEIIPTPNSPLLNPILIEGGSANGNVKNPGIPGDGIELQDGCSITIGGSADVSASNNKDTVIVTSGVVVDAHSEKESRGMSPGRRNAVSMENNSVGNTIYTGVYYGWTTIRVVDHSEITVHDGLFVNHPKDHDIHTVSFSTRNDKHSKIAATHSQYTHNTALYVSDASEATIYGGTYYDAIHDDHSSCLYVNDSGGDSSTGTKVNIYGGKFSSSSGHRHGHTKNTCQWYVAAESLHQQHHQHPTMEIKVYGSNLQIKSNVITGTLCDGNAIHVEFVIQEEYEQQLTVQDVVFLYNDECPSMYDDTSKLESNTGFSTTFSSVSFATVSAILILYLFLRRRKQQYKTNATISSSTVHQELEMFNYQLMPSSSANK